MRLIIIFISITSILHATLAKEKGCQSVDLTEEAEEQCNTTDYEAYVDCIRKLRVKRSTSCDQSDCDSGDCDVGNGYGKSTCGQCDCESCSYSSCQGSCNNCCTTCCDNFVPCKTNHCCHRTCHAECKTSSCRSSCRKSCYDNVSKETEKERIIERIFESDGNSSVNNTSVNNNIHNITTVINLKNVINNTNIVDVPINLNYTNQNNISLTEGSEQITVETKGEKADSTAESNCCIVIGPKQCTPINTYPFMRCYHTRSKQCGAYCAAPIVHQEEREVCLQTVTGQTTNCHNQMLYIPQPQPKCVYQTNWPYVSCGIQGDRQASCEGCYGHYVQSQSKEYQTCSAQCYDNGYGPGSYYRQGPFYQPQYSHAPPCGYVPGGCGGGYGSYGGGYGGYGGYPGGYYGPPMGMQPPMNMPMGPPYGPPMGVMPYYPPMFPNWSPENATWLPENITDLLKNENSTGLFSPVINVMQIPYPYNTNYQGPPKDVNIEVDVKPNKPVLQEGNDENEEENGEVPAE